MITCNISYVNDEQIKMDPKYNELISKWVLEKRARPGDIVVVTGHAMMISRVAIETNEDGKDVGKIYIMESKNHFFQKLKWKILKLMIQI